MSAPTLVDPFDVIRRDGRYNPSAFEFLHAGLAATVSRAYGEDATREPRHVTGRELAEGLRVVALDRWGLLARLVLRNWGIRTTRDFGEMIYLLIGVGAMGKQDSDTIEDFDDVYDFSVFDLYEPSVAGMGISHGGH